MLKFKNALPTCFLTFKIWCESNSKYFEIYKKMSKPTPFDVSLRDGLQSLPENTFTTERKKEIYQYICDKYNPNCLEIGSIVSKKVLPIFKDSIELFNYYKNNDKNNYLLVPNLNNLYAALDVGCTNFSLITSVSDSFQLKNTKKNIIETKRELYEMITFIENSNKIYKANIKLYISCINECPIEGKISISKIINEINFYYNTFKPDILCLSDTCGTLSNGAFVKIIDNCDVPYSRLGIHLHCDDELEETELILKSSFERNIFNIDVSLIESGGCSVTIKNPKKNLTYDTYYKVLAKYIIDITK
jgi:isopropylmalate/homocitrate/citramalate synthase